MLTESLETDLFTCTPQAVSTMPMYLHVQHYQNIQEAFMKNVSVLIGGRAGDGINSAGALVAQLLNHIGYHIYLYFDYPSLIRGGHNFAVIRGSEQDIGTCWKTLDFLLAINRETVEQHKDRCTSDTAIIFNADQVKSAGQGVPVKAILAGENAPAIMGNSAIIGGFAKSAGIEWDVVEDVFRSHIPKGVDLNLKVARKAYDQLETVHPISKVKNPPTALVTGNEAIGLGMINGGLDVYVSYPMTPSSSLLHFLAEHQEKLGITVVHPESEIAVILMALGFAYAGKRSAVGTSGGGFCLMTEGLSLAGHGRIACHTSCVPADRPLDRAAHIYRPVRPPFCLTCRAGGIPAADSRPGGCSGGALLGGGCHAYGLEVPDPCIHPLRQNPFRRDI